MFDLPALFLSTRERHGASQLAGEFTATFTLIVTAGNAREEHDGLTLKKGRTNIATKVNAASTLVRERLSAAG